MARIVPAVFVAIVLIYAHGALASFEALANGTNQIPPINTTAVASAVMIIDGPNARVGVVRVIVSNITDLLSITLSMNGSAASTVLWVFPTAPPTGDLDPITVLGSLTLTHTFTAADLVGSLGGARIGALWNATWAGQIWVNVTTLTKPTGYLLRRFSPASEVYNTDLSPSNSVPPLNSSAYGAGLLAISPDYTNGTVKLLIRDTAGYFMSHIHLGNSSTNGPILLWINPLSASLLAPQYFDVGSVLFTVTFNYTALVGYNSRNLIDLAGLARNGSLYANVHTQANPGGVIRGNFGNPYPVPRTTTARPAPPSPPPK